MNPPEQVSLSHEKMVQMVDEIMRGQFLRLRDRGKTNASTPEEFYGFRAEDVFAISTRKHGFGRGLWYLMKDGRVFDAFGMPSELDRDLYESKQQ